MKPVSATVEGYRRFGKPNSEIDLRGDLVAVVGPNEAGKSSLLEALLRFEDSDPIDGDDLTRSGDGTARLQVVYRLDDDDKASLYDRFDPALPAQVTHLVVERDHKGQRSAVLRGRVPKPADLLGRPVKQLASARKKHADRLGDETAAELAELLDALVSGKSPTDPLTDLRAYADSTLAEPESHPADREVAEALNRVLRLAHRDPNLAMASYLWKHRSPTFLKFTPADRDLRATYTITEKGKARWNAALFNLARFSGLDLDGLLGAAGNHDMRQSLLDGPNRTIEDKLIRQWNQHGVTVRLSMNGDILHVSAYDPGHGNYLPISSRSEGLRQFVAITTFVDAKKTGPGAPAPVLLLDEAEQHLHYDAQADLVNVLVAQRDLSKVVYTTHSAGCLPPDIGTGVRALEPYPSDGAPEGADPDLTRPVNNVWRRGQTGYGPLLLLMGAGAFAFTAARRAVVAEGFTDLLLLPTLVREATGDPRLDYQVVPGLSGTPDAELHRLSEAAVNVVYLVDGDDAGSTYAERLAAQGVPRRLVVRFAGKAGPAAPEDAVRADVFLDAINEVLSESQIPPMRPDDVPDRYRWAAVKRWASQHGEDVPGKKGLALALLDRRDEGLLDGPGKRRVKAVHNAIVRAFGTERAPTE